MYVEHAIPHVIITGGVILDRIQFEQSDYIVPDKKSEKIITKHKN